MDWLSEERWVKDNTPRGIIEGCRNLYGGNLHEEAIAFKNELLKKGLVVREVGNGPRLHDGLIVRLGWLVNEKAYFALLKVDAREWRRQKESEAKTLINPPVESSP